MSAWIADTLVATTLLMAAVLLLRAPVRRLFGAGAAYALWLVPALRLVLPPLRRPSAAASIADAPVEIVWALAPAAPASAAPWLLGTWVAGALLFGGWHLVAYRRFRRRALSGAAVRDGGVDLVTTGAVEGPAAVGLLRPRILLPLDFIGRFTPGERALTLAHERAHHARRDLWANAAALATLSLHWFNPVAHRAYRAFRADQELACDAAVIGDAGSETRAAYAAAMVKSAWGRAPLTTCPMSRTGSLKRRLQMIGTHRKSALASAAGMAATAALAIGGLTLTASGAAAADPVIKMETIRIKRVEGTDTAVALGAILNSKCGGVPRSEIETLANAKGGVPRVILCSKDGAPVDSVPALQKARDRIASASNLDATERTKMLGALDEALAKARSR